MTIADALIKIGPVFLAIVSYGLLRMRLIQASQGFRIRAACEADDLFHNENVDPKDQQRLAEQISDMFDARWPWLVALSIIPGSIVVLFTGFSDSTIATKDQDLRKQIDRVRARLYFAQLLTSPLALSIFLIESAAITVVIILTLGSRASVRALISRLSDFLSRDGFFRAH